jgi:hypothetical protein
MRGGLEIRSSPDQIRPRQTSTNMKITHHEHHVVLHNRVAPPVEEVVQRVLLLEARLKAREQLAVLQDRPALGAQDAGGNDGCWGFVGSSVGAVGLGWVGWWMCLWLRWVDRWVRFWSERRAASKAGAKALTVGAAQGRQLGLDLLALCLEVQLRLRVGSVRIGLSIRKIESGCCCCCCCPPPHLALNLSPKARTPPFHHHTPSPQPPPKSQPSSSPRSASAASTPPSARAPCQRSAAQARPSPSP